MRHYGSEPPWSGKPYFGLAWVRVPEDPDDWGWTGGTVWELKPQSATLAVVSSILKEFYLPPLVKLINDELAFARLLNAETAA